MPITWVYSWKNSLLDTDLCTFLYVYNTHRKNLVKQSRSHFKSLLSKRPSGDILLSILIHNICRSCQKSDETVVGVVIWNCKRWHRWNNCWGGSSSLNTKSEWAALGHQFLFKWSLNMCLCFWNMAWILHCYLNGALRHYVFNKLKLWDISWSPSYLDLTNLSSCIPAL